MGSLWEAGIKLQDFQKPAEGSGLFQALGGKGGDSPLRFYSGPQCCSEACWFKSEVRGQCPPPIPLPPGDLEDSGKGAD